MSFRIALALVAFGVVAGGAGWWLGSRGAAPGVPASLDGPCPGGAKPLHWKAPMDPTYVRDAPGKSPMGMDLVPVCPGEPGQAGSVRISPRVVQNIGVKTAPVERRTLSRRIRAVGRVSYDERLVSHVHTKVQGWVEKLYVDFEGQMVSRGEPLLEVYSPELVSTQEELLLAARYRDQVGRSAFGDVAAGGQALFEATRRRLELFDIPERDIRTLLETGRQRGVAELSYLPGRSFEGAVTYVYPFLDPKTRTVRVRFEFDNEHLVLKPEMYANVAIEAGTRPDVVAVPEEAVIRSGRRSLVILARGEGRFEPRTVELGLDSGDGWIEIRGGLQAGETVVTSGQFLIDSESRLQEAMQKLLSGAEEPRGRDDAAPELEGHAMGHGEAGH
jgi:multidrug efflux pump subunit AcrA (membrane-fusion protein)